MMLGAIVREREGSGHDRQQLHFLPNQRLAVERRVGVRFGLQQVHRVRRDADADDCHAAIRLFGERISEQVHCLASLVVASQVVRVVKRLFLPP